MKIPLVSCLVLVFGLSGCAQAKAKIPAPTTVGQILTTKDVTLNAGFPIVLAADVPGPIRRAVQDLQRDLKAVLGAESPVLQNTDPAQSGLIIAGPDSKATSRHPEVKGWEAHGVFVREVNGKPQIILQGADVRGTLYAIYAFSEKFLGVPPLWYWSSWQPVRRAQLAVPSNTNLIFHSPTVKWRAWFPNDTDLLTPWENRSEENFQAIYETMLRLKLNTLEGWTMGGDPGEVGDVYSQPYRAGRDATVARDRGLAFTGHHINPLGAAYWHWEAYWKRVRRMEPPALSVKNVDAMREFWHYHVETAQREKLEMIWLLGFRGVRDTPFWHSIQDAPASDAERARIINEMMAAQIQLLKEVTGEKAPTVRVTLYNEMSEFFGRGLLKLPQEPNLISAFANDRRDHFPAEDVRTFKFPAQAKVGYYMNLQYTGTGSHLAQGEGTWKMERNFRMVSGLAPNGLEFSVVNAGNIREFVMELDANARLMWDMKSFNSDAFLQNFCATYYGAEYAAEAARIYRDFYASYWQQKKPDLPGFERQYLFHDLRLSQTLRALIAGFDKGSSSAPLVEREPGYYRIEPEASGVKTQVDAVLKGTAASTEKLRAVVRQADALLPKLAPEKRTFFNDNLRVQAKFMLLANEALHTLMLARQHREDGQKRAEYLRQTRVAVADMKSVLAEAEHSRFTGWYAGDFKFRLADIQKGLAKLQ